MERADNTYVQLCGRFVVELHGRRVTIWRARLAEGVFVPEEVQPQGRRRMTYDEFLRGVRA